jgi:hypothetical protein
MTKFYDHDKATARERYDWNQRVETEKDMRKDENWRKFVPRKASHKQGWRRQEVQPF